VGGASAASSSTLGAFKFNSLHLGIRASRRVRIFTPRPRRFPPPWSVEGIQIAKPPRGLTTAALPHPVRAAHPGTASCGLPELASDRLLSPSPTSEALAADWGLCVGRFKLRGARRIAANVPAAEAFWIDPRALVDEDIGAAFVVKDGGGLLRG
jgi:hypothetical protein